jgi:hypothetical protein
MPAAGITRYIFRDTGSGVSWHQLLRRTLVLQQKNELDNKGLCKLQRPLLLYKV